jgi:hypothetical protein
MRAGDEKAMTRRKCVVAVGRRRVNAGKVGFQQAHMKYANEFNAQKNSHECTNKKTFEFSFVAVLTLTCEKLPIFLILAVLKP